MLTVQDVLETLQDMIKDNPEIADFPVIYSIDDEGNNYHLNSYIPSLFYAENFNEYSVDAIHADNLPSELACNCVCIN
jgi:hypothetical protein